MLIPTYSKKLNNVCIFCSLLNPFSILLIKGKKSVIPIIESCNNILNKINKSPPNVIYSLALQSRIIISNDTGPGHIASLAKNNLIWIVNDNSISRANQPLGKHVYKIQSNSVKDISSQEVINLIEKNKLY